MRGLSSALSAASSACDHVRDWVLGTPEGTWVSMGVISDGSYGQPEGIVYSFPCTCAGGEWSIVQVRRGAPAPPAAAARQQPVLCCCRLRPLPVPSPAPPRPAACAQPTLTPPAPPPQGLPIDEVSAEKMRITAAELVEEKELAMECIKDQ
jgi:hypothetical protein